MEKLIVNIEAVISQLERDDIEKSRVSFDCEAGEIVVVSAEVMHAVEEGDVEIIANFPEWNKDLIETAENILFYEKERYIDVPERLLLKVKQMMIEYAISVEDETLREKLNRAIETDGGIEMFEKVLVEYPKEKDQWFDFRDESMSDELAAWFNQAGIEAAIDVP